MKVSHLFTITKVEGIENQIENLASVLAEITQSKVKMVCEGEGVNKHAHILLKSSNQMFNLRMISGEATMIDKYLEKENGPKEFGPQITKKEENITINQKSKGGKKDVINSFDA